MAKNKIKIVPKYKNNQPQTVSPQMAEYWKAFNAGRDYERKIAIDYFLTKMEELKQVEGIGDTLFQRIVEFVNKEWNQDV